MQLTSLNRLYRNVVIVQLLPIVGEGKHHFALGPVCRGENTLCTRACGASMSVQAIALCNDPVKTLCASHLRDGAFLRPKLHDIADVERHPPPVRR